MDFKESKKFYKWCYRYLGPFIRITRPITVTGKENISAGAAIICANHSAMIDPLLIALALDRDTQIHVLAKMELYKVPFVSMLLKKLGMIPVDRSIADASAVKKSLKYLKDGEKVVIFPEGTRLSENDANAAKNGAVRLAERAGVPLIPVFVPRKKPPFKKSTIVFGKPYFIDRQESKRTADDYAKLSEELMIKIQALEPGK